MKKIIYIFVFLFLIISIFLFFTKEINIENITNLFEEEQECFTFQDCSVEKLISKMTLEEKIGQMFMIGYWGDSLTTNAKTLINENHVGGVILLKYNFGTEENIKNLINNLQAESGKNNLGIPLFISVDQEGGIVTKLKTENVKEYTAQKNIKTIEQAYEVGSTRAKELLSLGFNLNYSPVLDNVKSASSFLYDRVFHGSDKEVIAWSESLMKGYNDNNLIAVPKHFPGHPEGKIDSHKSLPVSHLDKKQLLKNVENFSNLIEKDQAQMIMMGHILYDKIDADLPTSISPIMIEEILRQDLNYNGVVITDDMEMGALQSNYKNADLAVLAVKAGNDILMYVSTFSKQQEAYEAVLAAVQSGEISEERIDESVVRILNLKKEILK